MIPRRGLGQEEKHNAGALKSAKDDRYCDAQRGNGRCSLYRDHDDPRKSQKEQETEGQARPVAPDSNAVQE